MSEFDRLKSRAQGRPRPGFPAPRPDQDGKSALFSSPAAAAPLGAVTLQCSGCLVTTSPTPWQAVLAAVPSLHLPILRKEYPSWMRCPACRRRTWVRVAVRLR